MGFCDKCPFNTYCQMNSDRRCAEYRQFEYRIEMKYANFFMKLVLFLSHPYSPFNYKGA